jgi:hypothetical protein
MSDRELLERAAKAAGLTIEYWAQDDYPVVRDGTAKIGWNPLTFDSDALRLAVALKMSLHITDPGSLDEDEEPFSVAITVFPFTDEREPHGADPNAATRRAIVRAAAATLKD